MRFAPRPVPLAVLLLSCSTLSACGEPTSPDLRLEGDVRPVRSVLARPSGYTLIDLTPSLPAGHVGGGHLINGSGQAVFFVRDQATLSTTYYLWNRGTTSSYGTGVRVFEINDAGQVAGISATVDGDWHAFVWSDGAMTDLWGPWEAPRAA